MSILDFKCTKCGYCCRNLLAEEFGITSGLSLTEKEICLFDPKFVSPHMALGNEKTINIITFQLNQAETEASGSSLLILKHLLDIGIRIV
jgi:hypothetical protein